MNTGTWSVEEHDRFLSAIREFPKGPWSAIAERVQTRTVRQVQTHTQKYYEKILRRMRGLRKDRRTWARVEHRIEADILQFCDLMGKSNSISPPASADENAFDGMNRDLELNDATFGAYMDQMNQSMASNTQSSSVSNPLTSSASTGDLPSLDETLDFFIATMDRTSDGELRQHLDGDFTDSNFFPKSGMSDWIF